MINLFLLKPTEIIELKHQCLEKLEERITNSTDVNLEGFLFFI